MKTRRIFLQPGEPVELINHFGTSVLKATTGFLHLQPIVTIYEQPDVYALTPEQAKRRPVTCEPQEEVPEKSTASEPLLYQPPLFEDD